MPYDERSLPPGYAVPQWFFGVRVSQFGMWDPHFGFFQGLRVNYVYYGSPAALRVEPGDIITRVDGNRVETYQEFHAAVAHHPSGLMSLRVRDVRTGAFVELSNIQLAPFAGPGPGPGPGGP